MNPSNGGEQDGWGRRGDRFTDSVPTAQELATLLERELLESQRGLLALHSELNRKNEELGEKARALQETLEVAERLSAATERLGWEEELEPFFSRVSAEATGLFQPDRFAIFLVEKASSLRCVYSRGLSDGSMEKLHGMGTSVAEEAFRRRGFLCLLEPPEGPSAGPGARPLPLEGCRTLAVIPLTVRKEPKGVLCLYYDRARPFTSYEARVAESYGHHAANILQQLLLLRENSLVRHHLEDVLEHAGEAIFSLDADHRVVSWNRAAEEILGYRKEDLLGQKVEILFPEDAYPDLKAAFARLPSRGVIRALSIWMCSARGHRLEVELTLSALSRGGESPGVICIARDVSEWKRTQDLLVRSEKLASIGRLAARAAREILNPLHIIGLQVQMAERVKGLPRKALGMLNVVRQQVERISRLTANLRRFSRESPRSPATFDLRGLILETLSQVEDELRQAQIEVALDLSPFPLEITADREPLAQVLLNLISKAKEAMAQGGKLTVRAAPFQKGGAEWVDLRVEDTGCGVPPEDLGKVFDPLFMTPSEGRGGDPGLAVCFGIVESHGGTLSVESEPRGGTTFIVELPKNPGCKS